MTVTTIERLEALYGRPKPSSTAKEVSRLTPEYRRLIEASRFAALATVGPEGLDCSPRGDAGAVVTVLDDRTIALPDRRGNDRIDSLRNVVRDPRVALLFLIQGLGLTLRVNGRARIEDDPAVLDGFAVDGRPPRTVMLIAVESVYFQCARAVIRSGLWDCESHVAPGALPSPGDILAGLTEGELGGEAYDRELPERMSKTLW